MPKMRIDVRFLNGDTFSVVYDACRYSTVEPNMFHFYLTNGSCMSGRNQVGGINMNEVQCFNITHL